jgi:hypothetical protein
MRIHGLPHYGPDGHSLEPLEGGDAMDVSKHLAINEPVLRGCLFTLPCSRTEGDGADVRS